MRSRSGLLGALLTVLVTSAACGGGSPAPDVAPVDAADVRTAQARLADLPRAPRPDRDGSYDRAAFGEAWADVDGNGCNQRDDVLLRDAERGSTRVQQQGRCPHDVLAGRWVDPYTGRTIVFDDLKEPEQAQAIQIDHVVPLAEAWYSGARDWPGSRRERFANDVDGLLAVDGPTNQSKGDQDPASWRPRRAYQCAYAVRWIAVKHRWELDADASEIRALEDLLATC